MSSYEYKDGDDRRFWSKADKAGSCWLWKASTFRNGYGQFGLCVNNHRRNVLAHRVAFELANGYLPDDMQVDHTCFTKACVNPGHLRLATNKQNNEHKPGARSDSRSGIRGVSWHKARGKWTAQVHHNGKTLYLGLFEDIEDARAAVTAKRLELFTHNDVDRQAA